MRVGMQAPHRIAVALVLAGAASMLACASEQSRTTAQPMARVQPPPPDRAIGLTERQAPSELPAADESSDDTPSPDDVMDLPPPGALVGVRPDGTPVPASGIPLLSKKTPVRVDGIELPAGTSLVGSDTVARIHAFPEEPAGTWGDDRAADTSIDARGTDRVFESKASYDIVLAYIDRSLSKDGIQSTLRVATDRATIWSVRSPGGERLRVAVRNTSPTTIEIVEVTAP
jgi:hypothetical protein